MRILNTDCGFDTDLMDYIECLANLNNWQIEDSDPDKITVTISSRWCAYRLSFSWIETVEALHMTCALDIRVIEQNHNSIRELLCLINEQLWIGHFDLWSKEKIIVFRYTLLLSSDDVLNPDQFETLLQEMLDTCDRYYQTLKIVNLTNKSPSEALANVFMDTVGEA